MSDDEPQMAESREEWAKTDVHKASTYSCAKCGATFDHPDEVYKHLDTMHAEEKTDG